ncbi:MAG TPA: tetratricopeptide repeat protein [Rhizomicrobium sp.]|jgi:hypothetical protein|nr:tetratricopeptide repeat protein [Rhizomicrobium sp.]
MSQHWTFEADLQQAIAHHQAGRFAQAVALYRQVLARDPGHAASHDNLGHALASLGKFDESLLAFQGAIALEPDNAEFLFNLGYVLTVQGQFDGAIAAYRKAIVLKPDFAEAHFRLASVLCETAHVAESFAHYMRRAELVYGMGRTARPAGPEPEHKRKHDREQRDYLAGGKAAPNAAEVRDMFHIEDGSRVNGPAVNPASASLALMAEWRKSWPQLVVIDDFLTVEALEKLRRYCAGSTIWRRIYQAGYIGATPEDGLACPLLAQIAEETRSTFPEILAPHNLRYLGAFKYDSALSTGTNTHADRAAINVNFYIAPDEANLDPQSGGLDVWDVPVPAGEDMRKYNSDEAGLERFLYSSHARPTRIPHRANRAIIFKSNLFHKTSDCHFREGYLNKRINVSLLFGDYGAPIK